MLTALALRVGCKGPFAAKTLIPVNAKPQQVFDHRICKSGAGPLRVEIFVAEDQDPTRGTGSVVGGGEGQGVADMEESGW